MDIFKPNKKIVISLIVIMILIVVLARPIFMAAGKIPSAFDLIIIYALLLIPIITLYLIISLIAYSIKNKRKRGKRK